MLKNYSNMRSKLISTLMTFKDYTKDEEGNIKYDKNGNAIYQKVKLVVKHNSAYKFRK